MDSSFLPSIFSSIKSYLQSFEPPSHLAHLRFCRAVELSDPPLQLILQSLDVRSGMVQLVCPAKASRHASEARLDLMDLHPPMSLRMAAHNLVE